MSRFGIEDAQLLFERSAGSILAFCTALLSYAMWSAGDVVFGADAIRFLLNYTSHFPRSYAKQLRLQAHRCERSWVESPEISQARGSGVIV